MSESGSQAKTAGDNAADLDQRMTNIALDEPPMAEDEEEDEEHLSGQPAFGTLAALDVSLDTGSGEVDDAQFILGQPQMSSHSGTASCGSAESGNAHCSAPHKVPDGPELVGSRTVGVDSKLSVLMRWGERALRSTKQLVREQLSGGWRTIDAELEVQVALLKDTQNKYGRLVALTRALMTHVRGVVETQERLSTHLAELAIKSPELHDDFRLNADSQLAVARNGNKLLAALNSFVSSMTTLCSKTIADTLMTFDRYQNARLVFDAYRYDYEMLAHERNTPAVQLKMEMARAEYEANKLAFERLREDVRIKLRLLDENRVKVMHRQLIMYHAAIISYFSGDQEQLDATLSQFSIKENEHAQASAEGQ